MKNIAIGFINFYQVFLSFDKGLLSFLCPGGACKYQVSCSQYTKVAISQYGLVKGVLLGMQRIWRCK